MRRTVVRALRLRQRRPIGVDRVCFVETDLHRPGLSAGAFDIVYSSGVLHHTPDPRRAFRNLVRLARPGGAIVVGLYNRMARIPTRLRGLLARYSPTGVTPFDPVLRDRADHPERHAAWLRDQYHHPEEHRHTVAEVQRWFAENGVDYLRTYPSVMLDDEPEDLVVLLILAQLGVGVAEGAGLGVLGQERQDPLTGAGSAGARRRSVHHDRETEGIADDK